MKKQLRNFCFCLLVFMMLSLSVSAARLECWNEALKDGYEEITDPQEYERAVSQFTLGEEFVTYQEIADLGEFQSFQVADVFWSENPIERNHGVPRYFYTLRDANGFLLHLDVVTHDPCCSAQKEDEPNDDGVVIIPPERVDLSDAFWNDIDTTLEGGCLLGRLGEAVSEDMRTLCDEWRAQYVTRHLHGTLEDSVHNTIYQYDEEGDLISIFFEFGRFLIKVHGMEDSPLSAYPTNGKNTMMSRLLHSGLAIKADKALRRSISGGESQYFSVIISTVIGAAVAGIGSWLATYLVMRKKRGAPAPAMAGAPTEEVSAGSDVDVSAVPSGAAPAASESPTPTEAAATDTPTPEETPPPEG